MHSFWHFTAPEDLEGTYPHRVVPDGCVSILRARSTHAAAMFVVTGPRLQAFEVPVHAGSSFVGARLKPGVALAMLTYDPSKESYAFNIQVDRGGTGLYPGTVEGDAFIRKMAFGGTDIRYTIRLDEQGRWHEIGERSTDGESWILARLLRHTSVRIRSETRPERMSRPHVDRSPIYTVAVYCFVHVAGVVALATLLVMPHATQTLATRDGCERGVSVVDRHKQGVHVDRDFVRSGPPIYETGAGEREAHQRIAVKPVVNALLVPRDNIADVGRADSQTSVEVAFQRDPVLDFDRRSNIAINGRDRRHGTVMLL